MNKNMLKINKALFKWAILLISIPFIAITSLGIFISWYNNYNVLWFVSGIIIGFIFNPIWLFLFFICISLILSVMPLRYKIVKKGIMVKFIGRKNAGLVPWSDFEKIEMLKTSKMIYIYRKSTNFPTVFSYDLNDLKLIHLNLKNTSLLKNIDLSYIISNQKIQSLST